MLYTELASWWPLFSDPADYGEEVDSFLQILDLPPSEHPRTLLELGSGGGNLASHLKAHFQVTLSDLSPNMLAVSRTLNHGLEHIQGDMRSLRLDRVFDLVLIHDAIMYCTTPEDVRAALATAAIHCRPGGTVLVAPDFVRETFTPETSNGGEDGPDGQALRFLEWTFDPDPTDSTFETLYTIVIRDSSGNIRVELDRHIEGLFAEADWLAWFAEAGIPARAARDKWDRHIFVGLKTI
jgi:SAM-dependent methyltransferase